MRIHIIQHVLFEKPGLIMEWIKENNYKAEIVKVFKGDSFPKAKDISFLIVLGGPMSANEPDEWIIEERILIKEVVDNNKAMLGICLGAQQLAKVYGSNIVPSPKEVGWNNVTSLTQEFHPGEEYNVLHWHGEGFTLPQGSRPLYSSKDWKNQGFRIKNAVGVQFHLETTEKTVREIVKEDSAFLEHSIFSVTPIETVNYPIPGDNKKVLYSILDTLQKESKILFK